jgi:hypothetical protein
MSRISLVGSLIKSIICGPSEQSVGSAYIEKQLFRLDADFRYLLKI